MLIKRPQVHIVSRIVALATGESARAFFAVINIEGAVEVRFLGTKPVEPSAAASETPVLLLENPRTRTFGETPIRSIYELLSPFFTLDFLVNQLARAPSRS